MSVSLTLRTDSGDEVLDLADFEARVLRGEISPHSLVRAPALTGEAFVPASELELFRRLQRPRRPAFMRRFAFEHVPWITLAFIVLQLGVYFVTAARGPLELDGLVRMGGKVAPLIFDLGEVWRLLTANLLHHDALHVGLNVFVLLNVGVALENAYRPLDFLFLLVATALGAMLASLFFADGATVGSSGIVYGCLGATLYFGLRHRAILPEGYRRLLGEAAIPTVIVFLYIGWSAVGVDNSAHFGGLLTGLLVAPWLTPRALVEEPQRARPLLANRALPTMALLASVALGSTYLSGVFPSFRMVEDDTFGWRMPVPRQWRQSLLRPGEWSFDNTLPGAGRAFVLVKSSSDEVDPAVAARAFLEHELRPEVLGADVVSVKAFDPEPSRLGGHEALKVRATLQTKSGPQLVEAYFIPRGELLHRFVFTHDAALTGYGTIADRMAAEFSLTEPDFLREARARALLFPDSPAALARLGTSLQRVGEPVAAAAALARAVRAEPSRAEWRNRLARVLLQSGRTDEGCREAESAQLYAPDHPEPRELLARCELARGNVAAALARISEARTLAPHDPHLQQVEARLQEALSTRSP